MRLAPPPRRQRGLALVVILAVLVMFALYAAVSSLSDASVRVKRDQRSRDVPELGIDSALKHSLHLLSQGRHPGDEALPGKLAVFVVVPVLEHETRVVE